MITFYYTDMMKVQHHFKTEAGAREEAQKYCNRTGKRCSVYQSDNAALEKKYGRGRGYYKKDIAKPVSQMTNREKMALVRSYKKNPDATTVPVTIPVTVTAKTNPIPKGKLAHVEYDRGYVDGQLTEVTGKDHYGKSAYHHNPVKYSNPQSYVVQIPKNGKYYNASNNMSYKDAREFSMDWQKQFPNDAVKIVPSTKPIAYKRNPASLGSSVLSRVGKHSQLPYASWFKYAKSIIDGKHKKSRVVRSRKALAHKAPDSYSVSFARPQTVSRGGGHAGYEIVDNLSKTEANQWARQAKAYGLKEVRIY